MSKLETAKVREIIRHLDKYREDYLLTIDKEKHSGAIYHGKPVPFLYLPKIFTEQDIERFEQAVTDIFKIVNHTIDLYMKKANVRAMFGFDQKLEELILSNANGHGYSTNVPMGRFDVFYYPDGSYKFCELNTDGTSAMNEEAELTNVLLGTRAMREMALKYQVKRFELFDSWVEEVKEIYNEYRASNHEPPLPTNSRDEYKETTVAILDFNDKGNPLEFEIFKKHFQQTGFQCVIIDPRELTYKSGVLYYGGQKIDIIYRRLVTKDLMERYDEIPALIQGLIANRTCVIGPIKSQIIHSKQFFEVLYQPAFRNYLSADEIAYIKEHIPLTKPLQDNKDLNKYISDKDRYIIKPIDGYASNGVYAGRDYSHETWGELLKNKSRDNYIIQEYCLPPISENIIFDHEGQLTACEFYNITGLFVYNQKFAGIYSRAGQNAIISGQHDGYTLSSVVMGQ